MTKKPLLPPPLGPGDLVAVAAPAGPPAREAFLRGVDFIAGRGFRVAYREDIFSREGYLAGSDSRRAEELNAWIADPEVKAVLLARGGYGCSRLVGRLDLSPLRRRPKVFAGYSDATALLLLLERRTGLAVFHGPFVTDGPRDLSRLLGVLQGRRLPGGARLRPLRPGRARAPLTGGNLTLLAHSIGTPFEVRTEGKILFVEEVNEAAYRVDRLVRQLVLAGKFRGIAGLLVGRFTGGGRGVRRRAEELLLEALEGRSVPVAAGLAAGHGPGALTIPLGVPALLDASAGTLAFEDFLGR